jgi:putative ABC transport system substrate-binding protein
LAERAQQAAMPTIGLLNSASPNTFEDRLRAFREGLKESGYVEGDNVVVVYRWSEGQNHRLPALANELVGRPVAVIAALGEAATYAAKAATSTIPIVFNVDDDPVKLGLVANMARPDGNLTGTNFFVAELTAKRLELLRRLVPTTASRLAVLVNPTYPVSKSTVRDVAGAAPGMGFQIRIFEASTSEEIDAAFKSFVGEGYDALFVGGDPFYTSKRAQIVRLTAQHRIPAAFATREFAQSGGLMSYGAKIVDAWHQVGVSCRQNPERRKAFGFARSTADEIRLCHQPENCQSTSSERAIDTARNRRRGD